MMSDPRHERLQRLRQRRDTTDDPDLPGGLDLLGYKQLSFEERILRTRTAWNGSELRWLVVDNLEDPALLKQWQSTGSGRRVLITTRHDDWPRLV
jgi:hypothetical protein